jgi:Protein of unknown function (DUF3040)
VPLSEHEQRLLEQMERALYAEDPKLASALRGADLRAHYRRRALYAVGGFVVGVALLMTGAVVPIIPVSIVGFVLMLASALFAVSSWRRIPAPGDLGVAAGAVQKSAKRPRRKGRVMSRVEERWRRRRDESGH